MGGGRNIVNFKINKNKYKMRNRNLITAKLELLENKMKTLKFITTRNEPLATYNQIITESEELLQELQAMIDREDLSPNELNRI